MVKVVRGGGGGREIKVDERDGERNEDPINFCG